MVQINLIRNKDKNVSLICKLFFRIVFLFFITKKYKKRKEKDTHTFDNKNLFRVFSKNIF